MQILFPQILVENMFLQGAWGHRSKLSAFPDNTYRALQIYFCLGENRI